MVSVGINVHTPEELVAVVLDTAVVLLVTVVELVAAVALLVPVELPPDDPPPQPIRLPAPITLSAPNAPSVCRRLRSMLGVTLVPAVVVVAGDADFNSVVEGGMGFSP